MKKFVIIANPRTGSEYLVRVFNLHPDIKCLSEVFSLGEMGKEWNNSIFKKDKEPFKFLESLYLEDTVSVFGYKQISFWIRNSGFTNVKEFIRKSAEEGYKIIFLERENLLKEYISYVLLTQYRYIHLENDGHIRPINHKITISPKDVYLNIRSWNLFNFQVKEFLEKVGIKYLHLVYEKDFTNKEELQSKMFSFLGVRTIFVKDPLQITNPYPVKDILINYIEVKKYLEQYNLNYDIDNY